MLSVWCVESEPVSDHPYMGSAIVSKVCSVRYIVSYEIAKCIKEITRGSVICRYLTTNALI